MVQGLSKGGKGQGYTRSLSQLKAYSKCGEAFYLERFKRKEIPRRPAAWTILGIALHEAIMQWEKSERELDIIEFFDKEYDSLVEVEWTKQPNERYWILPPRTATVKKSIQSYKERGFKQLETYLASVDEAPWEISHMEKEFEIDLDGVVVRGAVDRILFYPGTDEYIVEDLKSGSPDDEEDKRQLAFYAFVARTLWDVPVLHGRYWYTKVDRPSDTVDLSKFDKKFWVKIFTDLDDAISREIFLPNPGKNCGLCSVKPWCRTQGWLEIGEELGD